MQLHRSEPANKSTLSQAVESRSYVPPFSKYYSNPWDTWNEKSVLDVGYWLSGYTPYWLEEEDCCTNRSSSASASASPTRDDDTDVEPELHHMHSQSDEPESPSLTDLQQQVPRVVPHFENFVAPDAVQMTWLAHASVLIEIDGWRVLADPVFAERGYKRQLSQPFKAEDLPFLDAVVISHNHFDHLNVRSVRRIHEIQARKHLQQPVELRRPLLWCVPMGLKTWMQATVGKEAHVEECRWWEELHCPPSSQRQGLKICFVPAQHWSGRTLVTDRNKSLWGGWVLVGAQHRAYFVGDTGYCSVFQEIGAVYGPIDMSAIPIGSYEPRWFMKPQHVNPEDAVRIHQDVSSRMSLAIHWGTYRLRNKPLLEPTRALMEALQNAGLPTDVFQAIPHGATLKCADTNTIS